MKASEALHKTVTEKPRCYNVLHVEWKESLQVLGKHLTQLINETGLLDALARVLASPFFQLRVGTCGASSKLPRNDGALKQKGTFPVDGG